MEWKYIGTKTTKKFLLQNSAGKVAASVLIVPRSNRNWFPEREGAVNSLKLYYFGRTKLYPPDLTGSYNYHQFPQEK